LFNIGSQELLVILFLVFLLFGPRHIPEVARVLGKGLGDIQRAMRGVEDNVRRAANDIPKLADDGPSLPAPKVVPALGSLERRPGPPSVEMPATAAGSSPIPRSDGGVDTADGRPGAGA
jgi:TatA/E family protein of Tat protein translocase